MFQECHWEPQVLHADGQVPTLVAGWAARCCQVAAAKGTEFAPRALQVMCPLGTPSPSSCVPQVILGTAKSSQDFASLE